MKILMMPPYFFPEQMSSSHLEYDRLETYSQNRIKVKVITPTPTRGVTNEERAKTPLKDILFDGFVNVERFRLFKEKKSPVLRAMRYCLQNLIQAHKGKNEDSVDVIYSGSTPPTQGLLCGYVKKKLTKKYKRYVPFVFCLQDIFPDSAVNAGLFKRESLLWKIGRKIENYTYKQADKIIVISDGFKRNIISKGVPENKIVVISNWIDLSKVYPIDRKSNALLQECGLNPEKYIVVYAGNIGEAQGAEILIECAKELEHYNEIDIVVFGGGSGYESFKTKCKLNCITNIHVFPLQAQERVSEVYSLGNVALITCKPGTGNAGLPSKTWSIMACNTPIIASFDKDSDLADVIREANAGYCIEPGNHKALTSAIVNEYTAWKKYGNHKSNIRGYALEKVSKDICVNRYVNVLKNVVKECRRKRGKR